MRVRKPGFLNSVFQQNNKAQQHGLMMGDDESCAFSSDGMGAPPENPRAGRRSHNEDGEDHDEEDDGGDGADEQQQHQDGNEDASAAASAPPEQAPATSGKQQGMKKTRAKSKRNLFALTQPVREEDNDDSPSGEGNKTASSSSSSPEASSAVEGTKKKDKKESSQSTKKETEAGNHSKKENAGKEPSTGEKKPAKKNKPKPKGAADAACTPKPQAQQQPPPAESVLSWSRQGATIARSALSAYTSSPRRTLNAIKPGGGAPPAAPRFGLGIVGGRDKNHAKEQAQDDSAAAAETATRNVDSKLKVIPASAPLELKLKAAVTKRGGGEESASFVQFTIGQTDVEDAVSHISDDAYSSSSSSSESSESSESTQSIDSQLEMPVPRRGRRSAEPDPVKNRKKDTLSYLRDTTATTTGAAAAAGKERRKEQSTSSRGSSYSDDGAGARKKEKSTDARLASSDVGKEKKKDGSISSRGTSSFDNTAPRRCPPGKEKKKDPNTKPSPPAPSTSSTSQRSKDSSGHNYTEEFLMQSMLKALAEETGEDITELAKKAGLENMRTTKATDKTSSTPPPPNEEDTHPDETGAATTIAKKRDTKPQAANKAAQGCPNVTYSLPTRDTVDSMKKQRVDEKVHQHHGQHPNHHHNEASTIQEAVGKQAASHNNDGPLQVNGTAQEKDTIPDSIADGIAATTKVESMEDPVVGFGEAEPSPEYEEQDSPSDKKQDAAGKAVTNTPHIESVLPQVETNTSSNMIEPSIQGVDIIRENTAMKEAEPEGAEQNISANEMAVVSYLTADLAVTGTRTRMKVDVVGDCPHVPHETVEPKSVHEQQASIDEYDSPSIGSQDRHSISSRERHHEKSHPTNPTKKVNGPNKPAFAKLAELLEKDKPTMEEEVMKVLGLTDKKKSEKSSLHCSVDKRKNSGRPLRQKSQPIKANGPSSELSSLTDARVDTRSSLFRSASDRKFNLDKTSQSEGLSSTIHGHDATDTETEPQSVRGSDPKISDGDLVQRMTRSSSARQLFQLKDTAGEEKVHGEEQQSSTPIWKISNPKIREALGLDQPKSEEEEKSDDNVIDVEKAMQERPEKSGKVRGTRGCSRRKPKESGPSGSCHGEPSDDCTTPEDMGYDPTGGSMHSKPSMPATPSTPVQRLQRRGSTRALTKDDQSEMPQAPMTPGRHRMSRRGSTGGAVNFNGTGRSMRNLVQTRSRPAAARECQTPRTDASPVNISLAKREPTNQSQSKRISTPIRMRRRLSLAETSSSISDQLMSAFSFPSVDEPAKAGIPAALPLDNAESTHETPLNGDAGEQGDEEIQLSKAEKDAERLDDGNNDDDDDEFDDDERIEEAVAKLSKTEAAVGEPSESSDIEDGRDSAADLLHDVGSMVDFARSQVAHPVCLPTPVRVNQASLRSALETPTIMLMDIRKIKMAEVPFVSLVGMASKDQEMRVAEESTGESAAQTLEKMNEEESASDAAAVAAATDNKMGNKAEKYLSNLPNLYARMTSELSESTTRLNKARENVSALEAEVKELQRHLRTLQQRKWNL